MKPLNLNIPRASNPLDQAVSCRIYQLIMHCLAIISLYTPLVWYILYLQQFYPQDTNVLDINLLHLSVVIVLLLVPLPVLSALGVKWCNQQDTLSGERGTD